MALQNLRIFLKMNKVNLFLKRSNWQYLLLMITDLQGKMRFLKTCICHRELANLLILKDISDEIGGDTTKHDFLICRMKCSTFGRVALFCESTFPK